MTGSVAIDVAIGLVFVYLLYSLFATIICEIVANYLGLRARNLREAIIRLLEDDSDKDRSKFVSIFKSLWSSVVNLFSRPGGEFVKAFYEQATIKYLARNDFFSSPSYISPSNFSKALIEIFRKKCSSSSDQTDLGMIKEVLENQNWIDDNTRLHILSLLKDANGDLVKFKILLERWYDSTMERAIGWYKQKIQLVLLIIGFFLAAAFNASTFKVVSILSKDKNSRDQMVKMATSYVESHRYEIRRDTTKAYKTDLDSLLRVKGQIEADVAATNSIMGLGWPGDSVTLVDEKKKDSLTKVHTSYLEVTLCSNAKKLVIIPKNFKTEGVKAYLNFANNNKLAGINNAETKASIRWWKYFWDGVKDNFWGFLVTAFAISLGSPFWFDLLNKLIQIRGSVRQPVQTQSTTEGAPGKSDIDIIQRKG
jgi:hypothetical protein